MLNYGEQEPAGEVPMPKNIAKKVEELHAALPEQFKDFIRRVAAVPKDTEATQRAPKAHVNEHKKETKT